MNSTGGCSVGLASRSWRANGNAPINSRAVAKRGRAMMIVYTIGRGGAPITPGPLIAVGPLSKMDGELIMIDPGVITIELAPHVSVIDAPAKTDWATPTFTTWFIA